MKNFLQRISLIFVCGIGLSLHATELPVRYKPGSFNIAPRKSVENWVSTIDIRYGQSSTLEGFDGNAQRTSALDIFGPTNLVKLGFGLENLAAANMVQTHNMWHQGYVSPVPPPVGVVFGPLDVAQENFVKMTGRVSSSEVTLNFEQNLFSGFFLQFYVPFRQLTIDRLNYSLGGSPNMPIGVGTVDNFMNATLPPIMREQGMEAPFTSYRKQAVSELVIGLGWQGFNNKGFGVIDAATGRIFVGGIIPGAGITDNSYMVGLPLGYDGSWGVHTRLELEIGIKKFLALGGASSVNIFFQDERTRRVMSDVDRKQTGLLSFAQARVGVDQGVVWDAVGFIKLHRFFYGLVTQVGYSFTRQEDSRLRLRDTTYLNSAAARAIAQNPPFFLNKEDVVNSDARLQAWERQMVHFSIGYDFALHSKSPIVAPYFAFQYGYPVSGRRIMLGSYLAGTASLQMKMLF